MLRRGGRRLVQPSKTHKGDEAHNPSHIHYILITESQAASVRKFGIGSDATLMHDFDHAIVFTDLDVKAILGLFQQATRQSRPDAGRRLDMVTNKGLSGGFVIMRANC